MAIIALEGMHFYAFHGFYEEEQIIGNNFILDVHVDTATLRAAMSDDLYQTVNYETIYLICQAEMKKPTQLLEALAQRIADRLEEYFETLSGVRVRVRKLGPPLGGVVDSAYVEVGTGSLNPNSIFSQMKDDDFDFPDFLR